MTQRIVNRYQELLARKERHEGRRITQRTAAEETGLTTVTIGRYARNEVSRYDEPILLILCNYLGCTIGEFLVMEDVDNEEESPENETALAPAF
jgi:transcriptional regulator with XRE-family HTH domain